VGEQCSPALSGSSVCAFSLASTVIRVALMIAWGTLFSFPLRAQYRTGLFQLPREHVRTLWKIGTSKPWTVSSTGSQCRSRHAQHSLPIATVSDLLMGHCAPLEARTTVSSPSYQSTKSCFTHSTKLQCPAMTWTAISKPPTRASESRMFLQRDPRLTCSYHLLHYAR
jgi:hypothetical protein